MRVIKTASAATGIFLAAAIYSLPVTAQPQERVWACVPDLGTALSVMEKNFGEFSFSTAVNEHDSFTVFTVDPEDRSWSMLLTMPNGNVCLIHFGHEWEPVHIEPGDPS